MNEHKDQLTALTIAKIYYQRHLDAPEAAAYLKQRGLEQNAIKRFELGYAPDAWRGLVDHYSSHKIRLAAKDAGLLTTPTHSNRLLDFFRGRLMFPIKNAEGVVVGYGGRLIEAKEGVPKYINTPETSLFNKSEILYGFHQNLESIRKTHCAILVEGYMDVVSMSAHGLDLAVAPMGTALTHQQVELLMNAGVNRLWICLDGDAAGQTAASRSIQTIMENYHPRLQVMVVTLPDNQDPDDYLRKHGAKAFQSELRSATPLPVYIHGLCSHQCSEPPSLEDKAAYALMLKPYIEMAAGALQDVLLEQCKNYTGLDQSDVLGASTSARMASEEVAEWHPLVAIAARLLVHADADVQKPFIAQLKQLDIQEHGYPALRQLAEDIENGIEPGGLLAHFATTLGAPEPDEVAYFAGSWKSWVKSSALSENLAQLTNMPLDHTARSNIKSLMRIG